MELEQGQQVSSNSSRLEIALSHEKLIPVAYLVLNLFFEMSSYYIVHLTLNT